MRHLAMAAAVVLALGLAACCKAGTMDPAKKSDCCMKAEEISAKLPECCKKAAAGEPQLCCARP